MSLVQQVINKAMVFALSRGSATSSALIKSKEFRTFLDSMSQIDADALGYKYDRLFTEGMNSHYAPCSHIEVYRNEHISANIFTLRANREIPIHDHPGMYGIMKVIKGKVRVISYTYLTAGQKTQLNEEWEKRGGGKRIGKLFKTSLNRFEDQYVVPVIQQGERILTVDDPPAILTPNENNVHRVQAVDDVGAFFDILTPPYYPSIPSRDCHYYDMLEPKEDLRVTVASGSITELRERLKDSDKGDQGPSVPSTQESAPSSPQKLSVSWLMRTPAPGSYWCVNNEYTGPFIKSLTDVELKEEIRKVRANE